MLWTFYQKYIYVNHHAWRHAHLHSWKRRIRGGSSEHNWWPRGRIMYISSGASQAVSTDCVIWILPRKDKMEHSDRLILICLRWDANIPRWWLILIPQSFAEILASDWSVSIHLGKPLTSCVYVSNLKYFLNFNIIFIRKLSETYTY